MAEMKKERVFPVFPYELHCLCRIFLSQEGLVHRILDGIQVFNDLDRSHIIGVQNAVILIEAMLDREKLFSVTQVPFAD